MVSYPIVIRKFGEERRRYRVLFPDFAGCAVFLPATTSQEYGDLIAAAREAASLYLGGQDEQPGWIEKRLKNGRRVDPPYTHSLSTYEEDELSLQTDVELLPALALALEFHWLRLDLGRNLEDMAALLDITVVRYRQIEQCHVTPNHREKARLRNLQARSQRIPSKSLARDAQGESDDASDKASSF